MAAVTQSLNPVVAARDFMASMAAGKHSLNPVVAARDFMAKHGRWSWRGQLHLLYPVVAARDLLSIDLSANLMELAS